MSDYTRIYNLTVKDSLPTGNSGKVIKGTELDAELNAVAAAVASKADTNSPTFTGTPLAPTASYGTNTTQLATTAFVQAALQALYPVGSVYINASVTTNPASLFGFGTWVTVGDGKVLVNQDTTDSSFDVMGETGGSKDAIVVSHTHSVSGTSGSAGAHNHTITDTGHTHPAHSFGASFPDGGGYTRYLSESYGENYNIPSNTTGISLEAASDHTHTFSATTASTGSSGTNANLQPYVVVKMWKRTA